MTTTNRGSELDRRIAIVERAGVFGVSWCLIGHVSPPPNVPEEP
jgi:hypothetical protein